MHVSPNNAPVALDDVAYVIAGGTVNGNVLSNDHDIDNANNGAALGLVVTTTGTMQGSQGGTFTVNPNGTWTYKAPLDHTGFTDCVRYTIKDAGGTAGFALTASASLCVTVGKNRPPVAVNDPACFGNIVHPRHVAP